ncbi:hypothetical protein [Microvirga sp. VF16]|uniref:hypothetical protein n=1 Tax=Microvirga sp. VF16 TaxID=2807101 RepID=UPI00193CBD42|nr:hypothetical protein [Microvirga sp. VF16]QRM35601.1 hypothetical protein JO965_43010 [Microvirga sp. VF16]
MNLATGTAIDAFVHTDTVGGIEVFDATRFHDTLIGADKIDLSTMDADNTLGDQALFIGTALFSKASGQLQIDPAVAGVTRVLGDTNGDGMANLEIRLTVALKLTGGGSLL